MVTTIGGIGVVDSTFQYVCGSNGNSMVIHTYESLGDSEENKFNSIVDSCIAGQQNCNIIVYAYLAHPASTWTFKNTDRQYRSLEKVLDTYAQIADALPPGCIQAHYARNANPKIATETHAQAMLEFATAVYEDFPDHIIQQRVGFSDEFTMMAIMGVYNGSNSRYSSGRQERSKVRTEPGVLPVHKAMVFQCSASAFAAALEMVSPSRNILLLPNTWFILIYVPITVLSS